MASVFGHAIASIAIGHTFSKKDQNWKFWLLGIFCSILPDFDVIGFQFGIPYDSFWGHRGFTHSIFFAVLTGIACVTLFYRTLLGSGKGFRLFIFFFLCCLSHDLLDAMTSGGRGIAFFSPFDNTRYFFPFREIRVSPIGIKNFAGEWAQRVLWSEFKYILIPSVAYVLFIKLWKKFVKAK